jgi:hypothetical protein
MVITPTMMSAVAVATPTEIMFFYPFPGGL